MNNKQTLDVLRNLLTTSRNARGYLTRQAETYGIRAQLNTAIAAAEKHLDELELQERTGLEIMQSVTTQLWNTYMSNSEATYTQRLDRIDAYYVAAGLRDKLKEDSRDGLAIMESVNTRLFDHYMKNFYDEPARTDALTAYNLASHLRILLQLDNS